MKEKYSNTGKPPAFHLTVDDVIFTIKDEALHVLLIKRSTDPFGGMWALPGGFLQLDETAAEAARRILQDKAGVSDVFVEQLYTFDDHKRDVRGHIPSIAHYALVPEQRLQIAAGETTQEPTLFDITNLPELAFDHTEIVTYALNRLRAKLEYTNIVFSLLPKEFTFNELQKTYETVLGRALDKRNFRKKYISLGLIKATGKKTDGRRHRPAELFSFTSQKAQELERWF